MSHLRFVTLTGVDEKTDLSELVRLSAEFPFVEWGVLYDESLAGRDPRYPSLDWISQFAAVAEQNSLYVALHLCGSAVARLRDFVAADELPSRTPATEPTFALLDLAQRFGRVQLNTVAKMSHVPALRALIQRISRSENRTRVILQWTDGSAAVCGWLQSEHAFEVLVDSSGGRGVERTDWPSLGQTHPRAGYAGGLGPDNLAEQLPRIAKAAYRRSYWVDMETKLRNEQGYFDLSRCKQALQTAADFEERFRFEEGSRYGNELLPTRELEGMWLDWFVGCALGYNMVVPPADAVRAMYLHRSSGRFEPFAPSEDSSLPVHLFEEEQIALTPLPVFPEDAGTDDEPPRAKWTAKALSDDGMLMPGSSMVEAGLRAIVAKHFGIAVSTNPVAPPPFGD